VYYLLPVVNMSLEVEMDSTASISHTMCMESLKSDIHSDLCLSNAIALDRQ